MQGKSRSSNHVLLNSAISIGISIGVYFAITYAIPPVKEMAIPITIGSFFLSEILLLMRSFREKSEQTFDTVESNSNTVVQKVENAIGMWNRMSDNDLNHPISKIISEYDSLSKENDPFFLGQLKYILNKAADEIRKLGGREILDQPMGTTNMLYMGLLYELADNEILAVDYKGKEEWWDTPEGKQYMNFNQKTCNQGVTIHRVFIIDKSEDETKLQDIIERHWALYPRAHVYVAKIDTKQQKELARNFLIFNNNKKPRYATWITPTSEKVLDRWNLTAVQAEVDRWKNVFDLVLQIADEKLPRKIRAN